MPKKTKSSNTKKTKTKHNPCLISVWANCCWSALSPHSAWSRTSAASCSARLGVWSVNCKDSSITSSRNSTLRLSWTNCSKVKQEFETAASEFRDGIKDLGDDAQKSERYFRRPQAVGTPARTENACRFPRWTSWAIFA